MSRIQKTASLRLRGCHYPEAIPTLSDIGERCRGQRRAKKQMSWSTFRRLSLPAFDQLAHFDAKRSRVRSELDQVQPALTAFHFAYR